MSDQQVKDLFEAAVASVGRDRLDIDAMVRSGRRRHRVRTASTIAVAVGVVAVVAVVLFAVRPGGAQTVSPVGPSPSPSSVDAGVPLALPTSAWKSGDLGRTALLEVTLGLSRDGCIVTGSAPGAAALVWPAGYTAERFGGVAVVRDATGRVVAQTGQKVHLGGGEGGSASGKCVSGYAGPFYIEQDPPFVTDATTELGQVPVPNLMGLSGADARSDITAAGLTVGQVTTQATSAAPPGTVTAVAPAAGSTVAMGTRIDVTLSAGFSATAAQTGLRGMVISAPTCEAASSGRPRLDVIPGQVTRYIVCPTVLNATTPPTGKTISVTPDQGSVFTTLDQALRTANDTTPVDVCVTKAERPRTVIAVTADGVWSVQLPVDACGFRLAVVETVLSRY